MSENDEEIPPENEPSSDMISARSALLDFFSDRATTFGGFVLAAIFGLVSIVGVAQGINRIEENYEVIKLISFFAFVGFAMMGQYSFRRFKHYADLADRLYYGLGKTARLSSLFIPVVTKESVIERKLDEYQREEFNKQDKLLIKKIFRMYGFDSVYFLIVVLMALTVYYNDLFQIIQWIFARA